MAKEFEDAVLEVLTVKTKKALVEFGAQSLIIGGGVSASLAIRNQFKILAEEIKVELFIPEVSASTDNALMIALAGYMNIRNGQSSEMEFKANGNLSL